MAQVPNSITLQVALQHVSAPDMDDMVEGWNRKASALLGPLSASAWLKARRLAQQSTLLRLIYCLYKEGFLEAAEFRFIVSPIDASWPTITLASAEDVLDLIYTRNLLDSFALTCEGPRGAMRVDDAQVLWNDVLRPMAERRRPRPPCKWDLAQFELLDSLNNETLSMARRLEVCASLAAYRERFTNAWDWLVAKDGMAHFLSQRNRCVRSWTERRDEALFLQSIAAASGHRTHPMAHTRTRLEGELDDRGGIIQPEDGSSPVSSLSTEEVLENGGCFGLTNALPVVGLHVKEAKIRALAREGGADSYGGVGELAPERYRARFREQNAQVYGAWAHWIREQGHQVEDYVPMPVHSLNIAYIKTFKSFLTGRVDGKPSLLFPPPGRRDLAIAAMTTSTTRTMAPIASSRNDHLKLPIPVQVTSCRRHLAPARVFSAPLITGLLESIVGVEYGDGSSLPGEDPDLKRYMKILPEVLGIFWDDKDDKARYRDAYFLGCIARENPARFVGPDEVLLEVNVLFERSPFTQRPWVVDILAATGQASPEGALAWFKDYADTVVKGQVGLLARYGLGLEAHQQNTLVLLDKASGRLVKTVNRDFADGLFIVRPLLALHGKDISSATHKVKKYFSDDIEAPTKQVYHGMVASHLYPLIRVLHRICGMDAILAKQAVRQSMRQTFVAARAYFGMGRKRSPADQAQCDQLTAKMEAWLDQNLVREKALLTMRLDQTFESPPLWRENVLHTP